MNEYIIGIDIGGTTYSSALFNSKLELVSKSKKELTSVLLSAESFLESLTDQVKSLINSSKRVIGIGIACPGPLDSKKGVILETPNLRIIQNLHLKKEIEARLELPVYIDNDANLFALGEWFLDSKDNSKIFGGVTIGTGLGFGIIINGKIFSGAHGLAAEYAISPLEYGNWESKVSLSAIKKIAGKYLKDKNLDPKDLYRMAASGNENAKRTWVEFGENLGMALSHFINLIDPHKISIGGGLSHGMRFFNDSMLSSLESNSPAYKNYHTAVVESKHKELSSQLGAAMIVKEYQ